MDPQRHHIEDVGRILLHAQRELSQIRAGLAKDGSELADPRSAQRAIAEALSRAENDLKLKMEAVLTTSVGHSVAALPTLTDYNFRSSSAGDAASRSLIDVGGRARAARAAVRRVVAVAQAQVAHTTLPPLVVRAERSYPEPPEGGHEREEHAEVE
jgi:hypothetical protein